MVSIEFLYFFLPLFMGLYAVCTPSLRTKLIPLGAAFLTAWTDVRGLVPLGVSVLVSYLGGIFIFNLRKKPVRKRLVLTLCIAVELTAMILLARSAYDGGSFFGLFGSNDPIKVFSAFGVMVYPVNSIAYCAEISRGRYECEHRFFAVASYVCFFPTFVIGPLVSFDRLREDLRAPVISFEKMSSGILQLLTGFACKLILSNGMYDIWRVFGTAETSEMTALSAWLGSGVFGMFFFLELYSFSMIASGLSLMLGIELPYNFRSPARSVSFGELMRRFNCSLYRFMRENIYLPCVRKSAGWAVIPAAFMSVFLTSLWYGFSVRCLIFGAAVYIIIMLERALKGLVRRLPIAVRRVIFWLLLMTVLPLLAYDNPAEAFEHIAKMYEPGADLTDPLLEYVLTTFPVVMLLGIYVATGLNRFVKRRYNALHDYIKYIVRPIGVIALLILTTSLLVSTDAGLSGLLL
ncbi:MAG: acyltransferase [Ruminococcus sp.]|nr:acyltransferase [Ruminococcus sp.]